MIAVFSIFALALLWVSFRSYRNGVDYLNYFRSELTRPLPSYTPFVTLIAPCRGVDIGLEENLDALSALDYPEFEVIFVVDDPDDPAAKVISRNLGPRSKMIVAPKAVAASQKVENLRAAVLESDPRSEVFAFVDSDVRTSPDWLRQLVGPLEDRNVGAVTGYRWFISPHPTFASELRSVWNASIASALGPNIRSNFCWGGAMAIRRDTFERLDLRQKWQGTLSDDLAVTRAMKQAGHPIVFVPGALTASLSSCTWRELVEFTTRQMKITRVYATDLWLASLLGSGLFVLVMTAAVLLLLFSDDRYSQAVSAATLAGVTLFSTAKARLRLAAVRLALPEYRAELRRQAFPQYTLWLITPALFFFNTLSALFSRRMTWRGTVYELKSPVETVIISD